MTFSQDHLVQSDPTFSLVSSQFEGLQEAENIKVFWQNCLHPSINKNIWSYEELDKLRTIAHKNHCINWELTAEQLGVSVWSRSVEGVDMTRYKYSFLEGRLPSF